MLVWCLHWTSGVVFRYITVIYRHTRFLWLDSGGCWRWTWCSIILDCTDIIIRPLIPLPYEEKPALSVLLVAVA